MACLTAKQYSSQGGGNGIGRETALLAAREGAKVVVNDLGGSLTGGDEGDAGPARRSRQKSAPPAAKPYRTPKASPTCARSKAWSNRPRTRSDRSTPSSTRPGSCATACSTRCPKVTGTASSTSPARQFQRHTGRGRAVPREGEWRLRAVHVHVGHYRQYRPGELCRGQDGHCRPLPQHRDGRRTQECPFQRHRPVRVDPHDRIDPCQG